MRRIGLPAADLQVGDHVYIYNHPLYKTFRPPGSWRGEHSLVYATGNRDYRTQEGIVFGGHGKNGTLDQGSSLNPANSVSLAVGVEFLATAHL